MPTDTPTSTRTDAERIAEVVEELRTAGALDCECRVPAWPHTPACERRAAQIAARFFTFLAARLDEEREKNVERGTFVIHFDRRRVHRINEPCELKICPPK